MTHDALIESFAIRVALGNNGGQWETYYTEPQKEHWRQFVRDLIVHIKIGLANDDDWINLDLEALGKRYHQLRERMERMSDRMGHLSYHREDDEI